MDVGNNTGVDGSTKINGLSSTVLSALSKGLSFGEKNSPLFGDLLITSNGSKVISPKSNVVLPATSQTISTNQTRDYSTNNLVQNLNDMMRQLKKILAKQNQTSPPTSAKSNGVEEKPNPQTTSVSIVNSDSVIHQASNKNLSQGNVGPSSDTSNMGGVTSSSDTPETTASASPTDTSSASDLSGQFSASPQLIAELLTQLQALLALVEKSAPSPSGADALKNTLSLVADSNTSLSNLPQGSGEKAPLSADMEVLGTTSSNQSALSDQLQKELKDLVKTLQSIQSIQPVQSVESAPVALGAEASNLTTKSQTLLIQSNDLPPNPDLGVKTQSAENLLDKIIKDIQNVLSIHSANPGGTAPANSDQTGKGLVTSSTSQVSLVALEPDSSKSSAPIMKPVSASGDPIMPGALVAPLSKVDSSTNSLLISPTPTESTDGRSQDLGSTFSNNDSPSTSPENQSQLSISTNLFVSSDMARSTEPYSFASQLTASRVTLGSTGLPSAVEQVLLQLNRSAKSGQSQMTIQLHPADLGRINIKLDFSNDGKVQGKIIVDNPTTLGLLLKDVGSLERALQEAGLRADSGSLQFSLGGQQNNSFLQPGTNGPANESNTNGLSAETTSTDAAFTSLNPSETYIITPGRVNFKV